jgi:hypothetical protein
VEPWKAGSAVVGATAQDAMMTASMTQNQCNLFDALPVPTNTTALYPNRVRDKAQVEAMIGLPEHPDRRSYVFRTPKGTVVAAEYVRIVYGDHGPYIEFRREQILCALKPKFGNHALPPDAYYEWLVPTDGSNIKVYDQKRDVKHVRNAPSGGVAGNRAEGYADYVPGMIYVSPWELEIQTTQGQGDLA